MILKEQYAKYLAQEQKEYKLELAVEKKQAQLAKFRKKAKGWIDILVKPLAAALCERMGGTFAVLGPFGLGNEISIHIYYTDGKDKLETCDSITFRPQLYSPRFDKDEEITNQYGLTIKDYSKKNNHFNENTVGAMNGFNYGTLEIPEDADLDWFVNYMRKEKEVMNS